MNCISFSNSVCGDGDGAAVVATGDADAVLVFFDGLCEPPQRAPNSRPTSNTMIGPTLLIAQPSKTFINLLVSNVHDRALRVLINDIKPATRARRLEKVVMRII